MPTTQEKEESWLSSNYRGYLNIIHAETLMRMKIHPTVTNPLSSISGPEDCYTVMNPAGNITMMPRNNHHSGQQWGSTPAATGEG